MKLAVLTSSGAKSSENLELPKAIFGQESPSQANIHLAYRAYLANQRSAGAKTLRRGEVRGGGKKPWRQKGTGRARVGSSRNPIWRGGGVVFGPTGEENYHLKISKQAKRAAVKAALSLKAKDTSITIISSYAVKEGKTRELKKLLDKLQAAKNVLLVTDNADSMLSRAASNIPNVEVVSANYLNVYRVMNADLIVMNKPSVEVISKWLEGKNGK